MKLSPPELTLVDLRGSSNLHNFVLSPMTTCPKLTDLDLSECSGLEYVLLQSQTLRSVNLRKCGAMTKVWEATNWARGNTLGGGRIAVARTRLRKARAIRTDGGT